MAITIGIKLQLYTINTNKLKFDTVNGIGQYYKLTITTENQRQCNIQCNGWLKP